MKGTKRQMVEKAIQDIESPFTSMAVLQHIKNEPKYARIIPTRNEIRGLLKSIEGLTSYKDGNVMMYSRGDE